MVNRLIEPSGGQILLDGSDVTSEDVTALRRRIGYVIQQVGLFPHLTIGRNVAVVPALMGWTKERQQARTDELLSLVGLEPGRYRNRYPSQLSGGERQRVGVASAFRTSSCACSARWPKRSSSSPTTSTRRSRWAT